jgi:protein phosphatase
MAAAMGKLSITPDSAQHIGARGEQQDAYACSECLAVVADGMGGMRLGKEASGVAISAFLDAYEKRAGESIPDALRLAAFKANASVLELADGHDARGEAGTTLIAAVIRDDGLYWISVGDSRIYLLDSQSITQLNEEHNLKSRLERLAARGLVSPEEAMSHPQREALLSYIGIEELTETDVPQTPVRLSPGCCVLLCSDGLYRALADDEILRIAWSSQPREMAQTLVNAAIGKGMRHQDNVTAITLKLDGGCDQAAGADAARSGGYRGVTLRLKGPG